MILNVSSLRFLPASSITTFKKIVGLRGHKNNTTTTTEARHRVQGSVPGDQPVEGDGLDRENAFWVMELFKVGLRGRKGKEAEGRTETSVRPGDRDLSFVCRSAGDRKP